MGFDRKNIEIFVSTKKGAFILTADHNRKKWSVSQPILLGNLVHHMLLDPRDGKTILMAARTGHLGPTIFRSSDRGKKWKEVAAPPAFPKAKENEKGLAVDHVFWLTPGHAAEPGVWYAGTSPQGLFRSEDHGNSWESIEGFNENPMRRAWTGGEQDGTPDGPKLHSILVDPRNSNHLYIGMSSGGVFESLDRGASWRPLNKGCVADFLPDPNAEYGHDPHCVRLHPRMPDRLYQQNHCGIYRMDRPSENWIRIGNAMPKKVGDIGFPLVLHPRNPDTLWVFPMDGTTVWPRTSPEGKPAVFRSTNAGKTWIRQDKGLPERNAWWTVKRQAMTVDHQKDAGVYFGTTSGEIWGSKDEGNSWRCLTRHLPHIYALEAAVIR